MCTRAARCGRRVPSQAFRMGDADSQSLCLSHCYRCYIDPSLWVTLIILRVKVGHSVSGA